MIKREVKPEKLGETLQEVLTKWADEQEKEFVKAVDTAIESCDKEVKRYIYKGHGVRSGTYRNAFAIDNGWKGKHHYRGRWHVEAPHYRLTHLIEDGHDIKRKNESGIKIKVGETKPIRHVEHGREIAEQVLDEKLEGLWRN